MKTKRFDCVEMKRKAQQAIYAEIKDMTVEEMKDYWRRKTRQLKGRTPARSARRKTSPTMRKP